MPPHLPIRNLPDSSSISPNHTPRVKTDLDESGQFWTNLNTYGANSQSPQPIPHNPAEIFLQPAYHLARLKVALSIWPTPCHR